MWVVRKTSPRRCYLGEEDVGRGHSKHRCGRRKRVLIGCCRSWWAGWAKEKRVIGKEVLPALQAGSFKIISKDLGCYY